MASTFGAAFAAAQDKARPMGYRLRRVFYPVIEVMVGQSNTECVFKGNLTKVEQFLNRVFAEQVRISNEIVDEVIAEEQQAKVQQAIKEAQ